MTISSRSIDRARVARRARESRATRDASSSSPSRGPLDRRATRCDAAASRRRAADATLIDARAMAATPDRDAARERRARDVDDDARVAARPDAAGATAETTRTPLTRTVGFAINAGARADADEASARWDGGVAMELRAMRRGAENAAGRGARGRTRRTGMAIPRGGGARGEGDADATRASRSPVMILPVRGRGKAREGARAIEEEFASKARVEAGTAGSDARDGGGGGDGGRGGGEDEDEEERVRGSGARDTAAETEDEQGGATGAARVAARGEGGGESGRRRTRGVARERRNRAAAARTPRAVR